MVRRAFLAASAALAGQAVLGANDRVAMGLIGCGGRGRYVAAKMRETPGVEFAAVCDVYEPNAAKARAWAGGRAKAYGDFRRVLDRKDIDAVLIATPDHWHAIPAVLACEAGKDVYVEKPLAHNIREGQAMLAAARRHRRIAQASTQQRSAPHFAEAARIVQSGELGDIRFVRVWNYLDMFPGGIGRAPDSPAPPGLDWDFFLGPAPQAPFNVKRFLSTYRWFWDYAGGFITDFGTHRFDTVHRILGLNGSAAAPRTISASGARFALRDAGEMPDILQVTYEYAGFVMSYECNLLNGHGLGGRTPGMRYYNMRGAEDRPHGMAFYGTNGTIFADRIGYEVYPEENPLNGGPSRSRVQRKSESAADATGLHAANFIECVRTRREPNGDIASGHRSASVAHLGNIAWKTGQKLRWDAVQEDFLDAPDASALLARAPRKAWDLIGA